MLRLLVVISLWSFITSVPAQTTIYRCGNLYTDAPCAGAKVLVIAPDQNAIAFPKVTLASPALPVASTVVPMVAGAPYAPVGFTGYSYRTPYGQITAPIPMNMALSASNDGVKTRWTNFTLGGVTYHNQPYPHRR